MESNKSSKAMCVSQSILNFPNYRAINWFILGFRINPRIAQTFFGELNCRVENHQTDIYWTYLFAPLILTFLPYLFYFSTGHRLRFLLGHRCKGWMTGSFTLFCIDLLVEVKGKRLEARCDIWLPYKRLHTTGECVLCLFFFRFGLAFYHPTLCFPRKGIRGESIAQLFYFSRGVGTFNATVTSTSHYNFCNIYCLIHFKVIHDAVDFSTLFYEYCATWNILMLHTKCNNIL